MIQVVRKWKVTVTFRVLNAGDVQTRDVVVWMHDNFSSNVLRTLAGLQFTESGLDEPIAITVQAVD